ncbi:MAG: ABC transporter substrate-binding protein [Betaproteobacteria bacterium]
MNPIVRCTSRVRRRQFLAALAALVGGGIVHAQPKRKPARIGLLSISRSETEAVETLKPFIDGMRDRGYRLGEDFIFEIRVSGGDPQRFPALAEELVALKPDIFIAFETNGRALAAKTTDIPIVLLNSIDPVAAGLVKSLARPGTNVTGMSGQGDALTAKQVELLVEAVPTATSIAMLIDPLWSNRESYVRYAQSAAEAKHLSLTIIHVQEVDDVKRAFMQFEKQRPGGLLVGSGGRTWTLRETIREGVVRLRLPVIGHPAFGSLASYRISDSATWYEAAEFVDRILKGARPADLPVRQATKIELVVNLKVAREFGIKVPQSILLRVDREIE